MRERSECTTSHLAPGKRRGPGDGEFAALNGLIDRGAVQLANQVEVVAGNGAKLGAFAFNPRTQAAPNLGPLQGAKRRFVPDGKARPGWLLVDEAPDGGFPRCAKKPAEQPRPVPAARSRPGCRPAKRLADQMDRADLRRNRDRHSEEHAGRPGQDARIAPALRPYRSRGRTA